MATKTLLSLAEFASLPDDGLPHELDCGELVTMTHPKYTHSFVGRHIARLLTRLIEPSGLGEVFQETAYLLEEDPATLRVPDVSVASPEQVAAVSPQGYLVGAPLLAVEIVSPSDTASALQHKVAQYLAAGCREVWAVFPEEHEITVYRDRTARLHARNEALESQFTGAQPLTVETLLGRS